jgi:hypothetical protein
MWRGPRPVARGKAARAEVPRASHGAFQPSPTRADPVDLLEQQGNGDNFDRAILEFSRAYADQNERDYNALVAAAKSGRIVAQTGL